SLSNSQCTISEAGPVTTTAGYVWGAGPVPPALNLPVKVAFTRAFAGFKWIFGGAQSNENLSSPWTMLGTWDTNDPPAFAPAVTPTNGAGSPQVFALGF